MLQPETTRTRHIPIFLLCVGIVALWVSVAPPEGWGANIVVWAMFKASIFLTMGLLGVIDPRFIYALSPGQKGIPVWMRIVAFACFAGAIITAMVLVSVRYSYLLDLGS